MIISYFLHTRLFLPQNPSHRSHHHHCLHLFLLTPHHQIASPTTTGMRKINIQTKMVLLLCLVLLDPHHHQHLPLSFQSPPLPANTFFSVSIFFRATSPVSPFFRATSLISQGLLFLPIFFPDLPSLSAGSGSNNSFITMLPRRTIEEQYDVRRRRGNGGMAVTGLSCPEIGDSTAGV